LFDRILKSHEERRQKHEQEEQLKRRLIREAGSDNNSIAELALNEIREQELLTEWDGILQNEDFYHANWQGAYLEAANLQNARLRHANLQGASLVKAYLKGANLEGAKFSNGTTLPDDTKYADIEQLDKFIDGSWYEENEGWWTNKDE
jgi:uncharacterized protein YjbI with pentapeptide repeats